MELRYYIDVETGLPHIYSHGVSEDEVEQVVANPISAIRGSRNSIIAEGQTRTGRFLTVVYVPDEGMWSAFVVTAYELRGKRLKALRRRRRKR